MDLASKAPLSDDAVAALVDAVLKRPDEELGPSARLLGLRIARAGRQGEQMLLSLVNNLEHRASHLARSLVLRNENEARALARHAAALDGFRDVALTLLGEEPPDIISEVDAEAQWLAQAVPLRSESPKSLEQLRATLDGLNLRRLERLAAKAPDLEHPGRFLQDLGRTRVELLARKFVDKAQTIEEARQTYWQTLEVTILAMDADVAELYLKTLADDVNDRGEDVIAQAENLVGDLGPNALLIARDDVLRTMRLTRKAAVPGRGRDLRRMSRRLRAVTQDQRVRAGQTRVLGKRGLRILDWSLLILIVVVLGLLIWTEVGSPSEDTEWTLTLIDTAICAVFLGEFAWRWSYVAFSPLYFFRCLLIDVIPSIPFALLTSHKFRALRALRGLRLALRTMRPVLRLYRIFAFALQGFDRLVRSLGPLLNRNVVLFDPVGDAEAGEPDAPVRLRRLHDRLARTLRLNLVALPRNVRVEHLARRAHQLQERLAQAPCYAVGTVRTRVKDLRDIRIEAVIETLLSLEADVVEDALGQEGAQRIVRILRLFDFPVLRRLPLIRHVAPGVGRGDPHEALARAGQNLGRALDAALDRPRFLGDMVGIISGSQVLDRMGTALVKMTQRPATRLLLLGFIMLIVSGLVALFWPEVRELNPANHDEMTGIAWFYHLLNKVVGRPLIILGAICLLFQAFGRWLRKVADQATDLYQKVAEAQGINLLKYHQLSFRTDDLAIIFDRCLVLECQQRHGDAPEILGHERAAFVGLDPFEKPGAGASEGLGNARDQVLMLYLDYLDGAILHRSNTKSTQQFLGNLDIEAIRSQRLGITAREHRKALQKLDLDREQAIPTGPYLWFMLITESLAQKTARLVLDYNRHAIPRAHRHLVPSSTLIAHERWSRTDFAAVEERRRATTRKERKKVDPTSVLDAAGPARFTALNFLTADADRDHHVELEFGPALLQKLIRDRQEMIREVFGTYPYESLPRHQRTINPYTLYFRWFGRGRVLVLLPRLILAMLLWLFRGMRMFTRLIREQLNPTRMRRTVRARLSTYPVAVRKINRMYRPVFMAAADLRAQFDVEYLGVPIPGEVALPQSFGSVRTDLDLIGASEHEREVYRSLREARFRLVERLEHHLNQFGWPEVTLVRALVAEGPAESSGTEMECLRAVTAAFMIDYERCRTYLNGRQDVDQAFREILINPGDLRPRRRMFRRHRRRVFDDYIQRSTFKDLDADQLAILRAAYARNRHGVRTILAALDAGGGEDTARTKARKTLAETARYPTPWSHQLVTLRTVQTLACLDIVNTRRVIGELGGYAGADRWTLVEQLMDTEEA